MDIIVTDQGKVLYRGSQPGLLLVTGVLTGRDKAKQTQTFKLTARSWGPPRVMAALALAGIRQLGRMRILASRDKSWLSIYEQSRDEAMREARKKLVSGVVSLVNQYAPLAMQVTPVVVFKKTSVDSTTIRSKTRVRNLKPSPVLHRKTSKLKHRVRRVIIGPGGGGGGK